MSLNDFEYVKNVEPEDLEKLARAYGRYEEAIAGEIPKMDISTLIKIRNNAKTQVDSLIDAATELGWDLGRLEERSLIQDVLDELEASLTNEEEDAKLTIGIIRKMLIERRNNV